MPRAREQRRCSAGHRAGEQEAVCFRALPRQDLDYYNVSTLTAALREARPAFLVNCAGYTGKPNVDACELHKTECLQGNAILPDVERIHAIMQPYSEKGTLLPRTMAELSENVRDFVVAENDGVVIGCGALHLYGKSEIRPGRKMGHITWTSPRSGGR